VKKRYDTKMPRS